MEIVCDCSVALAWGLPDERSSEADRILEEITEESILWVPALWWYELSNALLVASRRKRINDAQMDGLWKLYDSLPIETDTAIGADYSRRIQRLARKNELSAYDAAYLELARRKSLGLATLDQRLQIALRVTR